MKNQYRISILTALFMLLVACTVPPDTVPTIQVTRVETKTPAHLTGSLTPQPGTPTRTDTPHPLVTWTQAPSLTLTSTSTQTPTSDPNKRVTITPVPAAVCPPENASYQPVFPDLGEDESSCKLDLNVPILDILNQGVSLVAIKQALSRATVDGEPAKISPEAIEAKDLTGDGVPEFIFATDWLIIDTCKQGKYVEALNWSSGIMGGLEKANIRDINQDGLNEIIVQWHEALNNVSNNYFSILRWDGNKFVNLVRESNSNVPGIVDWLIQDVDGKGALELIARSHTVMTGDNKMHGPWRIETYTFDWNGEAYTLQSIQLDPPEYRFQAVQDGDRAMRREEYQKAIPFFRQAIEDPKLKGWGYSLEHHWQRSEALDDYYKNIPTRTPLPLDPSETPVLAAYAHFRILQAYVGLDDLSSAQAEYQKLQKGFPSGRPGSAYAALAKIFWESSQNGVDLPGGCEAVTAYSNTHEEEILQPLNNYVLGFQNLYYKVENLCFSQSAK